jgi:hypothetical protein
MKLAKKAQRRGHVVVYPEKGLDVFIKSGVVCGAKRKTPEGVEHVCDQEKGHLKKGEPHRMHAMRLIWIACWS